MAILKNQEIHWVFLDPDRPRKNMTGDKKQWELQVRTKDKAQRKEWMDLGIKVKSVREDKTDEESAILYYTINFRKSAEPRTENGKTRSATPVGVVDAKQKEIDPTTIGSGSIANLLLYKREYTVGVGASAVDKVGYTLMKVQVTKLVKRPPFEFEDFDECEQDTEVVEPPSATEDDADIY